MDLYSEVQRVHDVRNRLRSILIKLAILDNTSTYDEEQVTDRAEAGANLETITRTLETKLGGGTLISTKQRVNVASKNEARAYSRYLIPSNVKRGVNILGVTGSYNGTYFTPDTSSYTWVYGTSEAPPSVVTSPIDASGFHEIVPVLATGNNLTLLPRNIRKGIDIMGVVGDYSFLTMNGAHYTGSEVIFHKLVLPLFELDPCEGLDKLTADQIQIGWVCLYQPEWHPPVRGSYYIYHMTFGRNPYDGNKKFLVIDTLLRRLNYQDRINKFYVDGAPYQIIHNYNGNGTAISFDLKDADFYCVDMHNCKKGSQPLSGLDDIRFDNGDPNWYHVDIRW